MTAVVCLTHCICGIFDPNQNSFFFSSGVTDHIKKNLITGIKILKKCNNKFISVSESPI